MKQDKKSKSQLTLIYTLTCLALIPIFVLNGYYIYQSRQKAVNEKVDKIKAITKSKQVTLENHLSNYIYFLETLAKSSVLKSDLKNSIFNGEGSNLVRGLQESMWGAYHHVFIADTSGNIIISPHHGDNKKSTHVGHSIKESKFFNKSLKSTQVTDFFGFEETTHYHQLVMVPIKDGEKTLGVIISEITIQFYIDLLKKDFELGKTGEVYVVDATNSVNGEVDWADEDSYLREKFNPRFINSTTEDAFYNFFVFKNGLIDQGCGSPIIFSNSSGVLMP